MFKKPMPMPIRRPPQLPSPKPIARPEPNPPKLKVGPVVEDKFNKIKKLVGR